VGERGEDGECQVFGRLVRVDDRGEVLGAQDQWEDRDAGVGGQADADGLRGPGRGGLVLADDEQDGRQ
jgi:hypothetical protein